MIVQYHFKSYNIHIYISKTLGEKDMLFTDEQKRAIDITDNNSQIIACAGSGKTTTMVAKIMNIIRKVNMSPENIVAITYTEKAAASLKQKIYNEYREQFGNIEGLANMYVGTIHGYCLYLLQEFSDKYKNYEILNDVQTRLFIKKERKNNGLFDVIYHTKTGTSYNLANNRMSNEKLLDAIKAYKIFLDIAREYGIEKLNNSSLEDHIIKYEKSLEDYRYFDFTSILIKTLKLLHDGDLDNFIEDNVKHMIIDEYQDVNDAQESIIRYFYEKGTKICVVGDDDQTIYHWRGSNLRYIREFCERYDDVKKFDLDLNFRSSIGITEVAKQVISNNINRIKKEMHSKQSQNYEKGDILVCEFSDRKEEINFIINKIKQLQGTKYVFKNNEYGIDLDDMVILVSSVKKIQELINALEVNNIDFLVEGTQKLFEAKEIILLCDTFEILFMIDDVNAYDNNKDYYLKLSVPNNIVSRWQEIVELPIGEIEIAVKDFIKYYITADQYDYTIQENLKRLFISLKLFEQNLDEKILYNWGKFTEIINDFEKINLLLTPWFKMQAFKSFIKDDAPTIYPEGWLSPNFKTIRCLRIMTFHQAKGLEYPVVFMPFLTKHAIFPLKNPGGISAWGILNNNSIERLYENDDESNRRLFYVGITRSEKYLFMTRSNVPYGNGKQYSQPAQPLIEAKNSIYVCQEPMEDLLYSKSELKKFSSDEIITLNFTLLKDLFDCPFKFKMLNVFNFTQPLNIRMGYGKSIHNMLDYVHKNYLHIDLHDEDTVKKIVEDNLYLPYGSKKLKEAMTEKAEKHLKTYILNNHSKFKYIKFSEKTIDYSMNEYLFINGRIDLVRDDLHNTTTIVDFKSNSEVLSNEQIKNQLMVYVLGYENLTGEKVDYIESYDFNKSNPTVVPIKDVDKKEFFEKLESCQEIIRNGKYEKVIHLDKSKDKSHCKSSDCAFLDNCFPKK